MLDLSLRARIFAFVQTLQVVEKKHIVSFFRNEVRGEVLWELRDLVYGGYIYKITENIYSTVRKLPMSIMNYEDRLRAIDVLCELTSDKVRYISLSDIPTELVFMDNDGQVYDVVVFTDSIGFKASLLAQYRKTHLPNYLDDSIWHIAVVPNVAMFRKIEYLGWKMYATIEINDEEYNTVRLYQLQDEP